MLTASRPSADLSPVPTTECRDPHGLVTSLDGLKSMPVTALVNALTTARPRRCIRALRVHALFTRNRPEGPPAECGTTKKPLRHYLDVRRASGDQAANGIANGVGIPAHSIDSLVFRRTRPRDYSSPKDSVASGTASSRARGMATPLCSEKPYVPASRRSSARRTCASRLRLRWNSASSFS